MRLLGLLIVAVLLAAPLTYFVPLAAKHDPLAVFSQYIGVTALISMALTQILATRLSFVEPVFGGLDRVYVLHKWLGISALVMVLVHDTVDADIEGIGRETGLTDLAETMGEISLYAFLILVLITIVTFIPYNLWKWSHKLMGTFFALSVFHLAFINKPFANTDPVGAYVLVVCGLGLLAYLYTLLPQNFGSRTRVFEVDSVEKTGDAFSVQLSPETKAVKHHAGQFAFINFDIPHLGEAHPFTISAAPNDANTLRFTIKPLGDYTRKLSTGIKPGTTAHISPSFGHFRLRNNKSPQIWIAGGIGVTPFLAWLGEVTTDHPKIDFFYCIRGRDSAPHIEEIEARAAQLPNLNLHIIDSSQMGRLTAAKIVELTGTDVKKSSAFFCGPEVMRNALIRDLQGLGMRKSRFHYEEFEIRSGIGIRKLLAYFFRKTGISHRFAKALESVG